MSLRRLHAERMQLREPRQARGLVQPVGPADQGFAGGRDAAAAEDVPLQTLHAVVPEVPAPGQRRHVAAPERQEQHQRGGPADGLPGLDQVGGQRGALPPAPAAQQRGATRGHADGSPFMAGARRALRTLLRQRIAQVAARAVGVAPKDGDALPYGGVSRRMAGGPGASAGSAGQSARPVPGAADDAKLTWRKPVRLRAWRANGLRAWRWAGVPGLALLAGCAALLPRSLTDQPSGFDSFEAAARALDQAVPYRTTSVELKALGFDLDASPNVTLVPYPQLIARLAPNSSVPLDALDPGIRDCILARQACRVYEFHLARETRQREGNFLLDFLNFRRATVINGWRFDGLLVVRDGLLLFQSHAGEPRIDRTELEVRPLGPLQPAGESAGSLLRR